MIDKICKVLLSLIMCGYCVFFAYFVMNMYEIQSKEYYLNLTKNEFELGEKEDVLNIIDTNYTIIDIKEIDFLKLGKQVLKVVVNDDFGYKEINKEIFILDKIAPKIIVNTPKLKIKSSDNINIINYYTVKDADSNVVTNHIFHKNYVEIIAKDSSNNQSVSKIDIQFENDKVISKTESTPKMVSKKSISYKKINSKKYLFKDGYDFKTAYSSCKKELTNNKAGVCLPIQENGIYLGYELRQ